MSGAPVSLVSRVTIAAAGLLAVGGCSLQRLATGALSSSLAEGAAVYASDEDPELVREALPFALKTYEMLLESTPEDPRLLLTTCSGFVQYSRAFVEEDAFYAQNEDHAESRRLYKRARDLYLRARRYCLRGLEVEAGVGLEELTTDTDAVLEGLEAGAAPLLYWTGAAWGSAIGVGLDQPELVIDLPVVRKILRRCRELDPDFDRAAVEEALMAIESVPELLGGSLERARGHFDAAVEASGGLSLSPFVGWATALSVPAQNRAEFGEMLERALVIDLDAAPEIRLANELMRRRALYLQAHAEEYFIEE